MGLRSRGWRVVKRTYNALPPIVRVPYAAGDGPPVRLDRRVPLRVARPEQIFDFYRRRGLGLLRLTTTAGALAH